jgi:hypothetical protein
VKYIVVRTPNGEAPILFPNALMHRYVAELFAAMPVIAAGFVRSAPDGAECYGASAGLKIASRPAIDSALVSASLTEGRTPFGGA